MRPLATAEFHSTLRCAGAGAGVGGLGDVAGGEDVGVAGAQVLVHEDAAPHGEPGRPGQLDLRAHADGHGDEVAGDRGAVPGLTPVTRPPRPTMRGQVGEGVDLHALAPAAPARRCAIRTPESTLLQ